MVPGNFLMSAAILFAAVQLCLSSALGYSALFQDLEDQCNIQRTFGWKRCALRSAVVLLGMAVGESVPRFDIVMALVGGSLTGPLVFVLPPLIYSKAIALKVRSIRPSTPEIYSNSERRQSTEGMSTDPRIHSRSIYYGVLGVPNTEYHRYSYFYYDDLGEEFEEILDYDDNIPSIKKTSENFLMTRSHVGRPLFIDAHRPFEVHRETIIPEMPVSKFKLNCNFRRWNSWFGYLIVVFGIAVTISSTYINIKNTIRYVQFTPPCIMNVTIGKNSV